MRCRKEGHSTRRGCKWTLIMAIDAQGFFSYSVSTNPGTSSEDFTGFLTDYLFPALARAYPGEAKVLMFDNLSSHLTNQVQGEIANGGHFSLPRPPYRPVLAPIEYIFNQVQHYLERQSYEIKTDADFFRAIHIAISNLNKVPGFGNTFVHCGY